MGFIDLLDKNLIRVPVKATKKIELIEELIQVLDKNGALKDREKALNDVLKREQMGSTGLEKGIAVPHSKTDAVEKMVMAIGIAPSGIDFNALDGNPSTLFFMILAPPDQSGPHIEVLADIARATKSAALCRLLVNAADADEVLELFEET